MLRPLLTSALIALVVLARLLALPIAADRRIDDAQHLDDGDRNETVQSLPALGTTDARPRWVPNLAALVPKSIVTVVERRAIAVLATPSAGPLSPRTAGTAGARAPPVTA